MQNTPLAHPRPHPADSTVSSATMSTTRAARLEFNELACPVSVPSLDDLSEMTTEEVHHLISRTGPARPPTAARQTLAKPQDAVSADGAPPLVPLGRDGPMTAATPGLPRRSAGKRVSFDLPDQPSSPHTDSPTQPALTAAAAAAARSAEATQEEEEGSRVTSQPLPPSLFSSDSPEPTASASPRHAPLQPAPDAEVVRAERDRWRVQMQDGWFLLSSHRLRWDVEWLERGRQYRSFPIAARTAVRMTHTKSLCLSLNIDPELLGAEGWAVDSDSDDGTGVGAGPLDGAGRHGGVDAVGADPSTGTPLLPLFMWQFPSSFPGDPNTVLARLSGQLEKQYDTLAPRPLEAAHCPNPRPTELGQALSDARREAGDAKVLFHYFARGMPAPRKGNLFLLNTGGYGSSPYVKMPLDTLRARAGRPLVMVADCAEAGEILLDFERQFEEEHRQQLSLTRDQPFTKLGRPFSTKDLSREASRISLDAYGSAAAAAGAGGAGAGAGGGGAASAGAALLPPTPVNENLYFIGATGSSSTSAASGGTGTGAGGLARRSPPRDYRGGAAAAMGASAAMTAAAGGSSASLYGLGGRAGVPAGDDLACDDVASGRLGACTTHSAVASPLSSGLLPGQLAGHPRLPSDVLTSCLTTPIRMALLWFIVTHPEASDLHPVLLHLLPGALNDKKTPLGALQWYFLCVTESIAWSVLPLAEFSRLYREDVYVAPLFRGFLLAERIIVGGLGGTVTVYPPMPLTHLHPLWDGWDNLVERTLADLMLAIKPAPPTCFTTLEFREWLAIEETEWKYHQRELVLQRMQEEAATSTAAAGTGVPGVTGQSSAARPDAAGSAGRPTGDGRASFLFDTSRAPMYTMHLPVLTQGAVVVVPSLLVEELRSVEALLDKVTRQSFVTCGATRLSALTDAERDRAPTALTRARKALALALQRQRDAGARGSGPTAAAAAAARGTRPPLRPPRQSGGDDRPATTSPSRRLLSQLNYRNTALSMTASVAHQTGGSALGGDLEGLAGASASNTRLGRVGQDVRGFSPSSDAPLEQGQSRASLPQLDTAADTYEAYIANPFTTTTTGDDVYDAGVAAGGATGYARPAHSTWEAKFLAPGSVSSLWGAEGTGIAPSRSRVSSETFALTTPASDGGDEADMATHLNAEGAGVGVVAGGGPMVTAMPFIERMPILFQGLLVLAHRDKSTELVCRLVDCGAQGVMQCAEANMFRFVLDRYWSRADLRYLMPATLFIYTKSCYADAQLIGPAKQMEVVVRTCVEVLQCPVEVPIADGQSGTEEGPAAPPLGLWQHHVLGPCATAAGQRLLAVSLLTLISLQCDGGREACSRHGVFQLCGQLLEQACEGLDMGGRKRCTWCVDEADDAEPASATSAPSSDPVPPAQDGVKIPTHASPGHRPAVNTDTTTRSLLIAALLSLLVSLLHDLPVFTAEEAEDGDDAAGEEKEQDEGDGDCEGESEQPAQGDPLSLPPLDGTVRVLEATTQEMVSCVLVRLCGPVRALLFHPISVLRGAASRACQMILLSNTPTVPVKTLYVSTLLRRLCEREVPPFEINTELRLETVGSAYVSLRWMREQLGQVLPIEEIGVHVGRVILEWTRLKRKGLEPATPCLDENASIVQAVATRVSTTRSPRTSPSPSPAAVTESSRRGTAAMTSSSVRGPRFYVPPHGSQSYRLAFNAHVVSGSYVAQPPVGSLARSMLPRTFDPAAGDITATTAADAGGANTSPDTRGSPYAEPATESAVARMLAAFGNLVRLFAEHTRDVCPYVRAHARKVVLEELAPFLHVQWFDSPQSTSRSTRSGVANVHTRGSRREVLMSTPYKHNRTQAVTGSASLGGDGAGAAWTGTRHPRPLSHEPCDEETACTSSAVAAPRLLAVQSLRAMEEPERAASHAGGGDDAVDEAADTDPALCRRYLATLLRMALSNTDIHDVSHAELERLGGRAGVGVSGGFTVQESAYDAGKSSRGGSSRRRDGRDERAFKRRGSDEDITRSGALPRHVGEGSPLGTSVGSVGSLAGASVGGGSSSGGGDGMGAAGAGGGSGLNAMPAFLWPENVNLYCFSQQDDSTVKTFVLASLGYLADLLLVPKDEADSHHPYNLAKAHTLRQFEHRIGAGLREGMSMRLMPEAIGSKADRDAPPWITSARAGRLAGSPALARGGDPQQQDSGSPSNDGDGEADDVSVSDGDAEVSMGAENQVSFLCRAPTYQGGPATGPPSPPRRATLVPYASSAAESATKTEDDAGSRAAQPDCHAVPYTHERGGEAEGQHDRHWAPQADEVDSVGAAATRAGGGSVGITEKLLFHPTAPLIFGFTDRGYGLTWCYEPAPRSHTSSSAARANSDDSDGFAQPLARVGQVRLLSRYRLHTACLRPHTSVDPTLIMRSRYTLGNAQRAVTLGTPAEVEGPRLARAWMGRVRLSDQAARAGLRARRGDPTGRDGGETAAPHRLERPTTSTHDQPGPILSTALLASARPSSGAHRVAGVHLVDAPSRALVCVVQRSGAVQLLSHVCSGGAGVHVLASFESLLFDVGCRTSSSPLSAYQPCSQSLFLAHDGGVVQVWDLFTEAQTNLVQGQPSTLAPHGNGSHGGGGPDAWTALEPDLCRPSIVAAAASGGICLYDLRQHQSRTAHGGRHGVQAFAAMSAGGTPSARAGLQRHLGQPLSSALCMTVHFSSRYPHLILGGYTGTTAKRSVVAGWDDRMVRASQPLLWYPATPSEDYLSRAARPAVLPPDATEAGPAAAAALPSALHSVSIQGSHRHLLTLTTVTHGFALVEPRLTATELLARSTGAASMADGPALALRGVQQHRVRGELGSAALHPFQPLVAAASEDHLLLYGAPSASCW